jgi:hypothetical protein
MSFKSHTTKRLLRKYRYVYSKVFEEMLVSEKVGGWDRLRVEIESDDEMRHRGGCETLTTLHEISHIEAKASLGHLAPALPVDLVLIDFEERLKSYGLTLNELHLQHLMAELDKIEAQITAQMFDLSQGFSLGHRRNATDSPQFSVERLEYRFYFSMLGEATMSGIRLESLHRQTEGKFAKSLRQNELVERIEMLEVANSGMEAHLKKTINGLAWQPRFPNGSLYDKKFEEDD